MKNLFIIFLIVCVLGNPVVAQVDVDNTENKAPASEVSSGFIKVDTRQIEGLAVGKEIIAELSKLNYVSRGRILSDDWNLRFRPDSSGKMITVERAGFGVLDSFRISAKERLMKNLLDIVKWEGIWQSVNLLGNKDQDSKAKVKLELVPIGKPEIKPDGTVIENKNVSPEQVERFKKGELLVGDSFRIRVTNTGQVPVYVVVLNLTPEQRINVLSRQGDPIKPGKSKLQPDYFYVPKDAADWIKNEPGKQNAKGTWRAFGRGNRTYKVFASEKPLAPRVFDMFGEREKYAEDELGKFIANLPTTMENDPPAGDWATTQVTFQIGQPKTLHILSVGINNYEDKILRDLQGSHNDARGFSAGLDQRGRGFFDIVNKKVLIDAKRDEIVSAFREVIDTAQPQDLFVFQFSGSSGLIKSDNKINGVMFFPADMAIKKENMISGYIEKSEIEKEEVKAGITDFELQNLLSQIQAQQQFIIFDSNDSTAGVEKFIARLKKQGEEFEGLVERNTWILGYSEKTQGLVIERQREISPTLSVYMGDLSYSLIKGLSGEADLNKDNLISVKELSDFSVKFVSNLHGNKKENEDTKKNGGTDFFNAYPKKEIIKVFSLGNDFDLGRIQPKTAKATFKPPQFLKTNFPLTRQDPKDETKTTVRAEFFTQDGKAGTFQRNGKDYALLIATNDYEHWTNDLKNPVNDAEAIAKELKTFYGFEIDMEKDVLRNPTKRDVRDALKRFKLKKYNPDDQLFLFFAGHGHFSEDGVKEGYLAFADTKKPADDEYFETFIAHSLLRRIIDSIPSDHIFVVIDACFGGTFDEAVAVRGNGDKPSYADSTNMEFIWRKMQFKTRRYLTSGGKEYVPDGRPGYHSPFAGRLLEALRNYGGKRGILTITTVLDYVQFAKPIPQSGTFGNNQPGSDFIFQVKKKDD